jgi:hypothetical protein
LPVKDHFAVPGGVVTVDVNAEYDHALPAAAFIESSTFMPRSHVEAD